MSLEISFVLSTLQTHHDVHGISQERLLGVRHGMEAQLPVAVWTSPGQGTRKASKKALWSYLLDKNEKSSV
jgi:hypothetical protein